MKTLKSNEGFISILLTIIITALLVGGGVYYYQKTSFDNSLKEKLDNINSETALEIDQLKSQIEDLEKEVVVEDVIEDTSSWQTYKNSWLANYSGPGGQLAFDFQFKYPNNLKVDGDNLYRFIRENNSEDGFLVRVSAQAKGAFEKYKKDQNKPSALLDDFIINEVSCAADGAGVSIYCKDAMIYEQGTSKNGIKYFVLSMKEITTYSDDRPDQERSRGPIYVLDIREQTKGEYELLFFSPESKGLTYSGLGDILKGIVDSFSFPADISDWQTYKNENRAFAFKYPANWGYLESDDIIGGSGYEVKAGISEPIDGVVASPAFYFAINPDGSGPYFPNKTLNLEVKDGKFSILREEEVAYNSNQDPKYYFIIASNEGTNQKQKFWMSFRLDSEHKDEAISTMKNIIESFQF